ncbi:MAG TPA: hypothetical protein VME19_12510 [Streptosporangiaceae bacterium]|nr:hypothetical protein [Streptosporangiaceae bacterium]
MIRRTAERKRYPFWHTAVRMVELANPLDELITSQPAVAGPEIAARHDQHSYLSRRLDNTPERLVRVQADNQVVVVRHGRGIDLGPGRHPLQRPAARIYYLRLEAEALTEYPGQHSLAASYVRDVPGIRKAVGYEARDHLEAGRISVKTVPGHQASVRARANALMPRP